MELKSIKDIPETKFFTGGSPLCSGCCAGLGLKMALKALGKNTIGINCSGCLTLLAVYPYTPLKIPWIHVAIENGGAVIGGIRASLRKSGRASTTVMCYAGDGATYDIGLQSLSAACERGEDFIYICYNNQSYGNTGVQWSSATPYGARTATTPIGKKNKVGNLHQRKDIERILAAHENTYIATATPSFPIDYMRKLQKAKSHKGPAFVDLLCPCPTGWQFDPSNGIEVGKLAVQTGMWPLYEILNYDYKITYKPKKLLPVGKYLSTQKRFSHLPPKEISEIQRRASRNWERLLKLESIKI